MAGLLYKPYFSDSGLLFIITRWFKSSTVAAMTEKKETEVTSNSALIVCRISPVCTAITGPLPYQSLNLYT